MSLCEKKQKRREERSKKLKLKQWRVQHLKQYLEDESSSESKNEDDMRCYAELNERIIETEQHLLKDSHYLFHDEIGVNAVDEQGKEQAVWLDCDMRMTKTGEQAGKRTMIAPFQITYVFDGMRINRRLYELNTNKEMTRDITWQYKEVNVVPVTP